LKPDKTLDAIGMHCPLPILRISKKIQAMEAEKVLLIIADDTDFKADVEAWCKTTGNELLKVEERDGEINAWIKKS